MKIYLFSLLLLFSGSLVFSQVDKHDIFLGLKTGFGSEFKNSNYTFTNQYYKMEFNYMFSPSKGFRYGIVVQPEVNLATHQLLNFYFVTPAEENYLERRERFTKSKSINQYILNVGFQVNKRIYKQLNVFVLGSVGPMISDTETERLSKGFAFSDVFSLGLSLQLENYRIDVGGNVRHESNAGLQSSNAGFNTRNLEIGFSYKL